MFPSLKCITNGMTLAQDSGCMGLRGESTPRTILSSAVGDVPYFKSFFYCFISYFVLTAITLNSFEAGYPFAGHMQTVQTWSRGYKTQLSMKFFQLINVKMPTIVGILTFMSGKNSILGLSEPNISHIS